MTPENVDVLRHSFLQSPQRSTRKHATALGLSASTVGQILGLDLKFHVIFIMTLLVIKDSWR